MYSPVEYAECWCCGEKVTLVPGGTSYTCEPCGVKGSIAPGAVGKSFAYKTRLVQGAEGHTTAEPYIDHGEEHMPSPA